MIEIDKDHAGLSLSVDTISDNYLNKTDRNYYSYVCIPKYFVSYSISSKLNLQVSLR